MDINRNESASVWNGDFARAVDGSTTPGAISQTVNPLLLKQTSSHQNNFRTFRRFNLVATEKHILLSSRSSSD